MNRIVLSILSAMLLVFGACTKKKVSTEKVLNLAIIAKVKGMDPIYANDLYSHSEARRAYETLLHYHQYKRPYQLRAELAETMPTVSEDGLTYTFKVRKGVFFHDNKCFPNGKGRELTAHDFVYSIKRLADPKLQALGWWTIDGKIAGLNEWRKKYADMKKANYEEEIEGLKALDKYTIQFKLTRPSPQFLYALAMGYTSAVAKEAVEFYGKEFLNNPVGTGPFILKDGKFTQTNKIVWVRNKNYRKVLFPGAKDIDEEFKKIGIDKYSGKQIPFVDKVVVNIIVESQPRWLNFRKGKVDFLVPPKDNFDSVISSSQDLTPEMKKLGITLYKLPALDVTYTGFNHDLKLFQNVKLRRAMSLAVDITKENKLFYNSVAIPAQSIVPPGIAGYIKDYKNPYRGTGKKEDLERAQKLMAEAGYPNGKGLPEITMDVPSSTQSRQRAEFLKNSLAKIGVKIRVVTSPWPEFTKKILKRQIMMYGIAWAGDYPDAENFLQLIYGPNRSPGANGSGYDNPEFNRLYKVAVNMQDGPERTAMYEKMYKMAAEEVPWIYGVHRQNFNLSHAWLKNYIPTDFRAGQASYLDVDIEKKNEIIKKL